MNNPYNDTENKGLEMSDRDYLTTMLEIEKNMSNNYSIAMNEASTDDLYESFFDMFTSIKDTARDIFDLMKHYGWYKLENIDQTKIDQKLEDLTQKLENLEN